MKSTPEKSKTLRHALRRPISIVVVMCMTIGMLATRTPAANPASGSISPAGPVAPFGGSWDGTLTGTPPAANGEGDCIIVTGIAGNCDDFTLTVTGTQASWIGKRVRIKFTWTSPST